MAKVLYISLNGMTEPLGESQVIQYLLELAKYHSMHLLSFEKAQDQSQYLAMQQRLTEAGIQWRYLIYSNRYGIFSTLFQLISAFFVLRKLIKSEHIDMIHSRSFVPGVMGLILKKIYGVKLIFDIRGFALDEKIIDGRLREKAFVTKVLKKIEKKLYQDADHIVTLTHASRPIIEEQYQVSAANITVIPTCANGNIFKQMSAGEKKLFKLKCGFQLDDIIILHNGSLNGWVDFIGQLKLFVELAQISPKIKFLFLNRGQHDQILDYLKQYRFSEDRYKIVTAHFTEVYQFLNITDLCIFFIKPSFAKLASNCTKFAELIACRTPSISNLYYGDMEYYLKQFALGLPLDLKEVHRNPPQVAKQIYDFLSHYKEQLPEKEHLHEQLFTQHFSLEVGVGRYLKLYDTLIGHA